MTRPNAHSIGQNPSGEYADHHNPAMPATRIAAQMALPWYEQRVLDAYRKAAQAERELTQCRGERAVVKSIAAGEFEDTAPAELHAVGSQGTWCIDPDARYDLTTQGRADLHEALA